MKKRTFANRIEQLGRIANAEGEIMRRNHQRGTMKRTAKAKKILWQYMDNIFGRVLDTTNPADKEATTARSYTNAQFAGKQENSNASRKAATAAALFLLSLTIGTGSPAQIYTNDPAAVLAEVAAAGETVTAYTIAEA